MGKSSFVIKSIRRLGLLSKENSILMTKPYSIPKDSIFAYSPNYKKACDSWYEELLFSYNDEYAKKLAKLKVGNDMMDWGMPIVKCHQIRRASDPKLLDIGSLGQDASSYVMNITNKARAMNCAKYSSKVAERLKTNPELFALSEEEALSKTVLDKAFATVEPNAFQSIEYRGAALRKDSIEYKNLLKLKKGDIHLEPGYVWTSPESGYAFGRYADATGGFLPQASIKYNILMPKGAKMLCVDRLHPETLLKYNSQFKVHNIKTSDSGNIELFLEYLVN